MKDLLCELDFDVDVESAPLWVAKIDNKVVGIMQVDEYPDFIFISNTGVSKVFRKQGIARQLLDSVIAYYKKPAYLHTIIPDFYLKCGFKIIPEFCGVAKNPKECAQCEPEKCVCMTKIFVR